MSKLYAFIFAVVFSFNVFAIETSDVTVTTTWTQISAATTGTLIFQNSEVGRDSESNSIRYAWMPSTTAPAASVVGGILMPGQALSRGTETGHLFVKCYRGTRQGALTE